MADILLPSGFSGTGIDPKDLTATSADILKDKIAGVSSSNKPVRGTLSVQNVRNFSISQYLSLTLMATWTLPAKGPWSGIRIMCRKDAYPSTPEDGILFYEGSAASASKTLAANIWYFRSWNYMNTNYGRIYGDYQDSVADNKQIKGQQIYTSSGTFTVPANVRQIQVFVVGGGGSGAMGNSDGNEYIAVGGGGGGGFTNYGTYQVSPGARYTVAIGAGGAQNMGKGYSGGTTSFGSLISASGGGGGYYRGRSVAIGGNGGSGGGADTGNGGSNGGNGGGAGQPGIGQVHTTKAFGEASGTLYAGGGGGGGINQSGGPGAGGGAWGSNHGWQAPDAAAGTGGGGGGGVDGSHLRRGSAGGSGICIVRWGY